MLAKGKGRTIEGVASTSFGKSLAWHWDSGSARALIAKGYWDFVVLQDPGPRDVPDREKLLGTLRSFDAEIRKVRPPEPYKGKGIRYVDEQVRRKVGKRA